MTPVIISILLATVKFGMTFPIAILEFRFSFWETVIYLNIGGAIGIYFFAYLSEYVSRWWNRLIRGRRKRHAMTDLSSKSKKKTFTKRNRRIITIKQRYGLAGIALATPVIFSIPIGVFLAVHYYHSNRYRLIWLLGSNILWSFIYTAFYTFCYHLIR